MTKLIYIAGSGHSGSTLLEMLLSSHPSICGLGETEMLLNDATRPKYLASARQRICSCGRSIIDCSLWGQFLEFIEANPCLNFRERYTHLLNLVYQERGRETVVADSSKYISPLHKRIDWVTSTCSDNATKVELFVVHLLKDVRAYATSNKWRYRQSRGQGYQILKSFYRWRRDNIKIANLLNREQIDHVRISYEDLCFNPPLVLQHICQQAGISYNEEMLNLSRADGHIGLGNPMRCHPLKSQQMIYDSRWFHETDLQILYLLLPGIRSCNERLAREHKIYREDSLLFEPEVSL